MKKVIGMACAIGGALCVLCKTFEVGMTVGIGYGLASNKDDWPLVTTLDEATKDLCETHNVTRWLLHCGEISGKKNTEENLNH